MNGARWVWGVAMVAATAGLAGCGPDQDELQQWMDQQKREVRPSVTPIEPPKQFKPEPYLALSVVEPFSNQKLSTALKKESVQSSALLEPELQRRKQALEAFPLDAIHMVGSVNKRGVAFALVKADGLLYQIKPGEYMGQNYGRVTKVTETSLTLRELVQDAAGEWVERPTTLELQEKAR